MSAAPELTDPDGPIRRVAAGRPRIRPLLLLLTFACCASTRADEPPADAGPAADRAPLVILAPAGPVFAELQISVDGQPYRRWVTNFLATRTDVNRDGQLSLSELELIPTPIMRQSSAGDAAQLLKKAAGPDADSIDVESFTDWLSDDLNRSFDVIAGAVQASAAVRLAGLIDVDGDGGISKEEVEAGVRLMRFRDLDDDQTFSAAELLPYRDPRTQQAAIVPDAAELPFVQLTDDQAIQRAVERILKRYGDGQQIHINQLRLGDQPQQALSGGELPPDGMLTADQCRQLLHEPPYHLTIQILLSDRTNASQLEFELADHAALFCQLAPGRRGRAKLVVDDMPIEIRARGGGVKTRSFLVSFLLQRFSLYDEDRNGYLTADEFTEMQGQLQQQNINADFQTADLNKDEMLLRDELKLFIERDAIATQSRIEVSVRQDGKTLFRLLDTNLDRRLTERELQEGFQQLKPFDLNSDGRLTESELGTAYALEIGLGQVDSLRLDSMMQNNGMGMDATNAVLPGLAGLDGPEWFRRMDRNQDRDVSLREFLGTAEQFAQLDTDGNGLLDAKEAEALSGSE